MAQFLQSVVKGVQLAKWEYKIEKKKIRLNKNRNKIRRKKRTTRKAHENT